jgi:UrcA family protein
MLSRFARISAAVLSGVTASLLVGATTTQAAQDRPVVVYGEPQPVNIERVPYGDLNLAASADRNTLYGRVGNAVRNVCNFDDVGIASDYRTCAGLAWKGARPQIEAVLANADRLAANGQSSIAAGAITISARSR